MRVAGGHGAWCEAGTVQKTAWRRRCEGWWVLGGWGMVVFGYVGVSVHVSNPPCKLPPHEPREGPDRMDRRLVRCSLL
jgi:hypothetical protein